MAKTASPRPRAPSAKARDRYLVFAFGIIFLSVILYLLKIDPNPSRETFFAFRLTLALAAGVWFTNPGELTIASPPPRQDALAVMLRYLAGNLDDAAVYDSFSTAFKKAISREAYAQLHANIRKPLGRRVAGPMLVNSNFLTDIGGRQGPFVQAGYQSRFEGSPGVWIEWSQAVAEDGAWRVDGYQLLPCIAPPCMPLAALEAPR